MAQAGARRDWCGWAALRIYHQLAALMGGEGAPATQASLVGQNAGAVSKGSRLTAVQV
jgi:hypothetical protein